MINVRGVELSGGITLLRRFDGFWIKTDMLSSMDTCLGMGCGVDLERGRGC